MILVSLSIKNLTVEFSSGGYRIRPLNGFSFDSDDAELVVLLGPSGCGKTTLLSCLAGLLTPASGSIRFNNEEITGLRGRTWPPIAAKPSAWCSRPSTSSPVSAPGPT